MNEVLLEEIIENGLVSVIPFDIETKTIIGDSIDVLSRKEANSTYEVVGEVVNGEIRVFGEESEKEESFEEFFDGDYNEE